MRDDFPWDADDFRLKDFYIYLGAEQLSVLAHFRPLQQSDKLFQSGEMRTNAAKYCQPQPFKQHAPVQ